MTSDNFDTLISQLSDPEPNVRRIAAMRLKWLNDQRAVEPLIKALEDESAKVRAVAAISLGHYRSKQALPALLDHLANDENGHVRAMCGHALLMSNFTSDEKVAEAFIAAAKDPDHHVKMVVAIALCDIKSPHAVDILMEMLDDPNWYTRESACRSLVELGIADERIVAAIDQLRHEPEGIGHDESVLAAHEFFATLMSNPETAEMITEFDGRPVDEKSRKIVREIAENTQDILRENALPDPSEWTLSKLAERAGKLLEYQTKG